jgi:hypothetical protein
MSLHDRITQHQKRRPQLMGVLVDQEPNHSDCLPPVDDDPENLEHGLPSSFKSESIQTAAISSLAELKFDLHCAMCDDALDSVWWLLGARAYALEDPDQHIHSQTATTRATASLQVHAVKISKA